MLASAPMTIHRRQIRGDRQIQQVEELFGVPEPSGFVSMVLLLCPGIGGGAAGKIHTDLSVDQLQIDAEFFALARSQTAQRAGFALGQQFFRHRRSDSFIGYGFPDHP